MEELQVKKDHLISNDEFMKRRLIFMEEDFDEESCNELKKRIIYLLTHDPKEPVVLYINSYGGSSYSLLKIIDLLRSRKFHLTTIALGYVMSGGAYLLLEGDTRLSYPNTSIMLHEVSSGVFGKLHDIEIDFNEAKRLNNILVDLVKSNTKIKDVEEFLKEDQYLSPKEAKKLGIIDKIIGNKKRKKRT
jgi:ATP-dependent Clp protease, protease subunit